MANSAKTDINKLSAREREVAMLILGGVATNAIAQKLDIKSNTVSTHRKNIYRKLGIRTSIDLYKKLKAKV